MTKGFNPMQQIKVLQDKMAKIQEELALKTVESSAGGGMVTAVTNGRQELVSLRLEPQVVDPEDLEMLRQVAVLHDIGKLGIQDAILNKPEKLSQQEWDIMD